MAVAAGGSSHVVVTADCIHGQYKPKKIIIACGDGSEYLTGLKWSSWSSTKASGTGTVKLNNCKPSCVAGHFISYPAKVALTRVEHCSAAPKTRFSRLTITYTHKHPGKHSTETDKFPCAL
jgi:hypothetical protein